MKMVVLADDLTGALEAGAKFAITGIASLVTTELSLSPQGARTSLQVLVIDTDSRHLSPSEAGRRIRILASLAHGRGIRYLYKKTDSTLRGNIGAELEAMSAAFGGVRVLYSPAYPALGRTVERGILYVAGRPVSETEFAKDALNPVRESHIPTLLARQCRLPVFSPPRLAGAGEVPYGIHVCDGASDGDLDACAQLLLDSPLPCLAAGPAALIHSMAESLDWPREGLALPPSIGRCLIVNGSRNETSLRQIQHALAKGLPLVAPSDLKEARGQPGWFVLKAEPCSTATPRAVARRTGEIVRRVLEDCPLDGLFVIGGDTARGVMLALGSPSLYPEGEVSPGVPLCRMEKAGPAKERLCLIAKAGGFGPVGIISEIVQKLK